MQDVIFSVSELNAMAADTLEQAINTIWVQGEISNLATPSSGHAYFSLKDDKAQVRCALFRGARSRLRFDIENGMQVVLFAKVSLYAPRGDYQLIVQQVEPTGIGALQQAFEALKKDLDKRGWFLEEHKQELPELPQRIGVVTSATGAALQDILKVLRRRFPAIPVIVYPTLVQGDTAKFSISEAIELANHRDECDVLILARGGGSLEDLWAFNEEEVASAVFHSDIPIVTGVGHEVDTTIVDYVADLRAATPSAAAECVAPHQQELLDQLEYYLERGEELINDQIYHYHHNINHLAKRLRHPGQKLQEQSQQLDQIEQRFKFAFKQQVKQQQQKLALCAQRLHSISPLATLERGYSILSKDGDIVKSSKQVKGGDTVSAKLSEGELTLVVSE